MKKEAIEYYHSLLNDSIAAENQQRLNALLKDRKLFFGERPLCTVLRPHFYTADQFAYLKKETEIILSAFAKTHRACMADQQLRAQFYPEPWEEEMMKLDQSSDLPWNTSRLDSFFSEDHGTLQFIEYNAETPAGMAYEDVLAESFLELPLMKAFQERYSVKPLAVRGHLLNALLQTYERWLGRKADHPPQISVVDWDDVPTRNEHRLSLEWFESHGVKTILSDPRNLEYRNGKLYDRDFRVDLIYKRVLAQELYERMGMNNPIFRAVRDRAVCISNSFAALLLYKKSSLAFLSDEANHKLFSAEEIRAIGEHIPWTRVVSDRKTYYGGSMISLVDWTAENRQKLVLKPNDSYGGKGVVLGWETSDTEWKEAIQTALAHPSVVQEKVNVASEIYPSFSEGRLQKNKLFVDADPFIFMGSAVHGVLTRLSSAALLNVTAGHGSTIPSFIVEKKG